MVAQPSDSAPAAPSPGVGSSYYPETPTTTPSYPANEPPPYDRPTSRPGRERTTTLDGMVPVRLVAGVLFVIFGVLVVVEPAIVPWVVGLTLVLFGVWLLVAGGYLGRPRTERTTQPSPWRP